MDSLKELYKIGPGPSSSHGRWDRSGPASCIRREYGEQLHHVEVELYRLKLSLTGKGHLTDLSSADL